MSHNPPNPKPIPVNESMNVLQECIDVMKRKADDYQNQASTVKQADYYPHGIQSLYDMVNTKRLRVKSLLDKAMAGGTPNHESIEDSLKDLINYAAFSVAWLRGKIEGQDPNLDMFNHPKSYTVEQIGQLHPIQADPLPIPDITGSYWTREDWLKGTVSVKDRVFGPQPIAVAHNGYDHYDVSGGNHLERSIRED